MFTNLANYGAPPCRNDGCSYLVSGGVKHFIFSIPTGSMYGIYANIGGILMVSGWVAGGCWDDDITSEPMGSFSKIPYVKRGRLVYLRRRIFTHICLKNHPVL